MLAQFVARVRSSTRACNAARWQGGLVTGGCRDRADALEAAGLRGCGAFATDVDHLVPIAAGGTDSLANLRPACARCNRGRRSARARLPEHRDEDHRAHVDDGESEDDLGQRHHRPRHAHHLSFAGVRLAAAQLV